MSYTLCPHCSDITEHSANLITDGIASGRDNCTNCGKTFFYSIAYISSKDELPYLSEDPFVDKREAEEKAEKLLLKVNKVTAAHRHGSIPSKRDLDELSNAQIEFEEALEKLENE